MVEVTEETLVQEVMVKVKEEMVQEVMGATWDRTEIFKKNSSVYNQNSEISESLQAFHDFCDEQNDPQSENEDAFETDTHMTGGNSIYPILPSENTHRCRKLFSPRHFPEKNQNNTVKKAKRLKPSNNYKSKIKNIFGQNSLVNCGLKPSNFIEPINTFHLTNKAKIQKSKIETYPSCVSSTTMTNYTMPVLSTSIFSSISLPKMSLYRNTLTNNDYNVLYDHNSDLYIPFQPVLNVDLLLKK